MNVYYDIYAKLYKYASVSVTSNVSRFLTGYIYYSVFYSDYVGIYGYPNHSIINCQSVVRSLTK